MRRFMRDGLSLAFADFPPTGPDRKETALLIHGFASTHAANWVATRWVHDLTAAGYRVVALDNRGHGQSDRLYEPQDYDVLNMANDARELLDHLGLERVFVAGYSLGARISAFLTSEAPERVNALVIGGVGDRLMRSRFLPSGVAEAMEAPSARDVLDPLARSFRLFAESTGSDLQALAACIRGARREMTEDQIRGIKIPVLVAVGTCDDVAGDPQPLTSLLPNGRLLSLPNRDHNKAVGDIKHRAGVVDFFNQQRDSLR